MQTPQRLSIGLFAESHSASVHLGALLFLAGHMVFACTQEEQSLETFLETMIGQPEQSNTSPYDLLIMDISSADVITGKVLTRLQYLALLERLPMILLTNSSRSTLKRIQLTVPHMPVLSGNPLSLMDLFEAIANTTGTHSPHSSKFIEQMQQIQRDRVDRLLQAEQAWINRRHDWLDQRHDWLDQRQKWLEQRHLWIEEQFQRPDPQREWLEEQQLWVQQQLEEVKQQFIWVQQLRLWLNRYRCQLDQQDRPPFLEAQ